MQVYLARDPFSERVLAQDHPVDRMELPRGAHGDGWPLRHLTVTDDVWARLLASEVAPIDQDVLHQAWWHEASPTG